MARVEVYPKIVIVLETTRTEQQIQNALDAVFSHFKDRIRQMVNADAQTTIVSWHYHLSTGPVDEVEP